MNIAQVNSAGVCNKVRATVVIPIRAFLLQNDVITSDHVPAGFEDSRLQSYTSAAIVVKSDGLFEKKLHFGDIEGSCGIIPHSDKLSDNEGGAILWVIIGIGIGFGLLGVVGQEVGNYSLITTVGDVVHGGIRGRA